MRHVSLKGRRRSTRSWTTMALVIVLSQGQVIADEVADYWPSLNILGHLGPIRALVFSHDSRFLCTGGGHLVQVWKLPGEKAPAVSHHATLRWEKGPGEWGNVYGLAARPGPKGEPLIAIGGHAWRAEQWRVFWFEIKGDIAAKEHRGAQRGTHGPPPDTPFDPKDPFSPLTSLACSPDGRWLATVSECGRMKVWNCGEALSSEKPEPTPGVPLAVRGGRPLISANYRVAITNKLLAVPRPAEDGGRAARVELYSLGGGAAAERTLPLGSDPRAVAMSPNAAWLAAGTAEGKLLVWELGKSGNESIELTEEGSPIPVSLSFTPSGDVLVAGYDVKGKGRLTIWGREANGWSKAIASVDVPAPVVACALSPDEKNRYLAYTRGQYDIELRDMTKPGFPVITTIATSQPGTSGLVFLDKGRKGSSRIGYNWGGEAWRLDPSGAEPKKWLAKSADKVKGETKVKGESRRFTPQVHEGHLWIKDGSTSTFLGYAPWDVSRDGDPVCVCDIGGSSPLVAVGAAGSNKIYVYAYTGAKPSQQLREVRRFRGHENTVINLDASADGRFLASSSADGTVRFWSLEGCANWDSINPYLQRWGAELAEADGKVVATYVDPSGPLAKWGVQRGDAVTFLGWISDVGKQVTATAAGDILRKLKDVERHDLVYFEISRPKGKVMPFNIPSDWEYTVALRQQANPVTGVEWAAWTPLGYFATSANGEELVGWQLNYASPATPPTFHLGKDRLAFIKPDEIQTQLSSLLPAKKVSQRSVPTELPRLTLHTQGTLPPLDGSRGKNANVRLKWRIDRAAKPLSDVFFVIEEVNHPPSRTQSISGLKPDEVEFERTLELPGPGQYKVSVGFEYDGQIGGKDAAGFATISVVDKAIVATKPPVKLKPKMYVLGIGCSKYDADTWRHLDKVSAEVSGLVRVLENNAKGLYDVVDLTPTEKRGAEHWTRQDIEKALDRFRERVAESPADDVGALFLAGHGFFDHRWNTYWFVPSDGAKSDDEEGREKKSWIDGASILNRVIPKAGESGLAQIVVVLDTCNSGALVQTVASEDSLSVAARKAKNDKRMTIIAAAPAGKDAPGESELAKKLLASIKGETAPLFVGESDVTKNRVVRDAQGATRDVFFERTVNFSLARGGP
jgi:WD40 repeat protein